jgi:hypothetical protein
VANFDCIKCMREGSKGSGRSSPSENSPARAVTLKATTPTRFGAVSGKVKVAPSLDFAENFITGTSAARPNSAATDLLVSGSRISSFRSPLSSFAPALFTSTLSAALSPSRKNRGR